MCQCLPDALEPPNQKIRQCRLMLQVLCASLALIGTLAILAKDIFGFINCLIYAYILYTAWATFNWCILLLFFMFLLIQTIQVFILFAGMIQYKLLFSHQYIMESIYVLLQVFYFPTAIFITHYVYRHFKNLSEGMMGIGQVFPREQPGNGPAEQETQQYVRMPQENGNSGQYRNQPQQNQSRTENNVFRGQGVRIG